MPAVADIPITKALLLIFTNNDSAVIGLITEGTNDDIGALTGKLGNLDGIIVKSALVPTKRKGEETK